MKKSLLVLSMMIAGMSFSFGQFSSCKFAEIEKFKQSGTVAVAISDDEETNKIAQEVMTSYWTASKVTVIKKSELEAYLKSNPENYVLTYLENNSSSIFTITNTQMASTNTSGGNTRTKTVADGLILTKNLKKLRKLKPTDAMVYCFIDDELDAADQKAEFIRQVGSMNSILTFPGLKEDKIGGWKVPTLNQKEIIKSELWIADVDLSKKGEDPAKMKAAYSPFKYKVVTKEEIAKAIIEKKKGVVYASHCEDQSGLYMFIIHNTQDNRPLYFMEGTGGFSPKTFDLIKANKVHGN